MVHIAQWLKRKLKVAPAAGYLETKSEAFRRLFPEGALIERVATEFRFTEGPVWFPEGGYLLFSDIPANKIYQLTPQGELAVFREPSGNANGLTRDREGRLIACEHGNRRVTRTEQDGSVVVLADHFQGNRLNSPNDVVVKSDGVIYFTDPPFGIKPEQQEQAHQGVYRFMPESGELDMVVNDLVRPNGLAFSPDEKKLYIDDSARRHVKVFDVGDDGTLLNGKVFHDMNIPEPGSPDGMKVDVCGHVYCTGAGGVWVFDAQGHHLGTLVTPETPANCAWGDDDLQSLYITARSSVYRVRVNIQGIGTAHRHD
jgi:gluconolactonase